VLIVMSLISRSYVLDLSPDNSFIGQLREAGLDVYLLDWGGAGRGRCRQQAGDLRR
jgi:polyhydroxyalkanoate synthase subunit PhaC